jgi:cytochrome c peroxidase
MIRLILVISLSTALLVGCISHKPSTFENIAQETIQFKIDTIVNILNGFDSSLEINQVKNQFSTSRKQYKQIEAFIEYYYQGLSRRINGPALPEIKTDDNIINDPTGFQVLEEIIYSDTIDVKELSKQAKILATDLLFIKKSLKDLPIQDHHFYELTQHQIIRIAALGLTGFDSPVAFQSIEEAKYALMGLLSFNQKFWENKNKTNDIVHKSINQAIAYLKQQSNFNEFNRLLFIKQYLMPLSVAFENQFKEIIKATPNYTTNKVFYGTLSDLMQGKNLNADAFSPFAASISSPQKISLGKLLFNDVSLSKSNNMSCATCHIASKAFTDGKVTSNNNIHSNSIKRNSPTLLYAAFQKGFFYDLRSQDLENQIESVMKNPDEFNLSPKQIQQKINNNLTLSKQFAIAYPNSKEITAFELRNAIAAYVRSLMPFNSKIDQYFKGQTTLTESEINGFNVFTGKAKCATCHFIPLYSGTIPPWYNNTESEVIGVPKTVNWKNAIIDSDLGRYNTNQLEPLRFSFKTSTVRNIQKTAPYMHNGVYTNLNDVIKFYELGGGNGIGMHLKYQTLPFDNLQLTTKEKQDLINFMNTLTDNYEE